MAVLGKGSIYIGIFSAVIGVFLYAFLELDLHKRVYNHVPGECHHSHSLRVGAAQIVMFDNTVIFTGGADLNNATNSTGALYAWAMDTRDIQEVAIMAQHEHNPAGFNPHGLSTHMNILMVTVSTYPVKPEDRIDIFTIERRKPKDPKMPNVPTVQFVKSVSDPLFTGLVSVAAITDNKFYASNRYRSRHAPSRFIENIFNLETGSVVFYDGKKVQTVIEHLPGPTGIAYDPRKRHLYVSLYGAKAIAIYRADFHNVSKVQEIKLFASPYFIALDYLNGNFLVAIHPIRIRHIAHEYDRHNFYSPSQILKIQRLRKKWIITQLYANDGATISAATSAHVVYSTDKQKPARLLIGNVHNGLLSCDLVSV
uniref:Arylesterase n=1 Tax=Panagrellus redivivus TaxID=6233 RepID=A0A7E4VBC3_PANRE